MRYSWVRHGVASCQTPTVQLSAPAAALRAEAAVIEQAAARLIGDSHAFVGEMS